jgi:hypothetical protein
MSASGPKSHPLMESRINPSDFVKQKIHKKMTQKFRYITHVEKQEVDVFILNAPR